MVDTFLAIGTGLEGLVVGTCQVIGRVISMKVALHIVVLVGVLPLLQQWLL